MTTNTPKHPILKTDPALILWLLDSDPAIRWQVMRDISGASTDEVAAERARVASEGLGNQLLKMQQAGWFVGW